MLGLTSTFEANNNTKLNEYEYNPLKKGKIIETKKNNSNARAEYLEIFYYGWNNES